MPPTHEPCILVRRAYKLSLDEGNVEDGSVEIDKLEQIDFESQSIVKFGLSSMELLPSQPDGKELVDVIKDEDEH